MIEEAPASDAAQDDETARELLKLVDNLVGRVWGHFQARVAEMDLSVPEGKALQALEPGQALLTTHWFWGPYQTLASHARRAVVVLRR